MKPLLFSLFFVCIAFFLKIEGQNSNDFTENGETSNNGNISETDDNITITNSSFADNTSYSDDNITIANSSQADNTTDSDEVQLVEIGQLYECAHHLKGDVYAENEREIIIKGFTYDGKGKAVWFHAQFKGSEGISGEEDTFMTLPFPNDTCDRLTPKREYKDEELRLILPLSIKNFTSIGLFCYKSCHNYGHVNIPDELEVPEAPDHLMETDACHATNGYLGLSYDTCYLMETKNSKFELNCDSGSPCKTPLLMNLIILAFICFNI